MRRLFLLILVHLAFQTFGQERSLIFFLETAVKNSPLYIENRNKIEALKIDSVQLRSRYKANVAFDSHNIYAPVVNGYGYDQIITNGGSVNALVGVNLPIVGKAYRDNLFGNIFLQTQSQLLAGQINEKELKKNITTQYITIYGEQEIIRNSKQIINVLFDEEKLLKKLTEDGIYSQTDYLTFLVDLKQQEINIEQQELQFKNDLALLNYSAGIADTSVVTLNEPILLKNSPQQIESTIVIKQFLLDSLLLKNQSDQIKFDYRPQFNLFGDAGYSSSLNYKSEKNFGASAGFHVFIPIYDGNLRQLRSQRIKLSENTRLSFLNFYKTQFTQEQLRIEQQLSETDKILNTIEQQVKLSEALIQADKKLLTNGNLRIADYLLAIKNYFTVKYSSVQLSNSKLLLVNEYNYLNY